MIESLELRAEREVSQLFGDVPGQPSVEDQEDCGTPLLDMAVLEGETTNVVIDARQVALEEITVSAPPGLRPLRLTAAELLTPLEPERYLLPGLVPTEAYTLIAGALSSYKSTLLIYLALWRATGFDLLELEGPHGAGCDIGPVLLGFYEDSDGRMCRRIRRIVQHSHDGIRSAHGASTASQFVERVERHLHRLPLTGQAGATIVCRDPYTGIVVPNAAMIRGLEVAARRITDQGLMLAIDPLRLAIVGSQNDDDGADVVVHTLNQLSAMLPDSGLVIASHTNKAEAKEPAEGYTGAAYATSGSALYSQHARSNFMLARLKADAAKQYDTGLDEEQLKQQPVARLTHGRLSHGVESGERVFVMDGGILRPVERRGELDAAAQMASFGTILVDVLDRLCTQGLKTSKAAIEAEPDVRDYGTQKDVRTQLTLLEQNGLIEFEGTTRDRTCRLTAAGKQKFSTRNDEKGLQARR